MPNVIFHSNRETFVGEVKENTNLVVRAGIRQFPYPNFLYGCGMGKCGKCASLIIRGGEHFFAIRAFHLNRHESAAFLYFGNACGQVPYSEQPRVITSGTPISHAKFRTRYFTPTKRTR